MFLAGGKMRLLFTVNWWAVLVCVVLSMVSGTLWYNPKTFFPIWWQGIGQPEMKQPEKNNMALVWGLTLMTSLLQVVGLAVLINIVGLIFGNFSMGVGICTGALVWLGIVAPTNLVNKLFAGYPFKVWMIEAGNHLLNFVLFGAILGIWR
jgi:hypothetical protein